MKNVLYERAIGPRPNSPPCAEAPQIVLTEEANGFAVFHITSDGDVCFLEWFDGDRSDAIERAVDMAIEATRGTGAKSRQAQR